MNARGHAGRQGRHVGRRAVLGAGVVGVGAFAAWKVLGGAEDPEIPAPPERQPLWTYALNGAAAGVTWLRSAGGSLYVTSDGPLSVHALDAGSGRRRWVAEVTGGKQGDAVLGPVTVADGTVYAVAGGGHVNAFADADGGRRWASAPLGGGSPAAPVVIGSTVCVLMQTEKAADEAGGTRTLVEGVLCGLAKGTGRVKWRTGGNRLLLGDPSRGQVIAETRGGERIVALDADSGDERWSLPKQDSVVLAANGKLMYAIGAGKGNELAAYDLSTGGRRWKSPAPPKESAEGPGAAITLSADGRTVYACEGGTGAVYAYDAATGDRRWRATVDAPVNPEVASGGTAVFLATSDGYRGAHNVDSGLQNPFSSGQKSAGGYVTARAAADGKQLWRTRSDSCSTAPAPAGSRFVLVGHGAELWAYDAGTGAARWRVQGEPGADRVPLVADGRAYVLTDAGVGAFSVAASA
ncbi:MULTISPECIES: PQQ-binding-like beta-propeller repeat protein [Streptomyces]|uniref:PQQ-binding-like beta-propeller repeat protein n=1 Tax=Streptomyces solicathayae TaxID=3081768 RepID=A0ABZ0LUI2_9ACTN|nr:PQQ-binding-like beta-propeller repeat protein [Streptomyces sp. HUAS YS2]WOX22970.1 PQQ-binding-like beta-propeller repeat protein [Streptomyces sp. HUAS YS2]